jgi:hypothetical protein
MSRLNALYRTEAFGSDKSRTVIAQELHRDLNDLALPEPDVELEDSELEDTERQAAIARERMRREGFI